MERELFGRKKAAFGVSTIRSLLEMLLEVTGAAREDRAYAAREALEILRLAKVARP